MDRRWGISSLRPQKSDLFHRKLTCLLLKFSDLGSFSVGDWIVEKDQDELTVLKCMPPSSFPVRDIHWAKITGDGKQPLTQSTHYVVSQEGDLHFAFVDKKDSGQYVCTVSNMFLKRNVVRTISLDVLPGNYRYQYIDPRIRQMFACFYCVMKIKGQRHVLEVLLSLAKNRTCFYGNVTISAQKLVLIIFDTGGRDKTGLQFENFQALTVYFGESLKK